MDNKKLTPEQVNTINQKLDILENKLESVDEFMRNVEKNADEIADLNKKIEENCLDHSTMATIRYADDAFKSIEHLYYDKCSRKSVGSSVLADAIKKHK